MTNREREAWLRAEREAARFRPSMQRAILSAWAEVSAGLRIGTIERLVRAGAIEAIAALVSEATGDLLGVTYTPLVRETFASAATRQMARLPSPLAGARFDLLNPETVRSALRLESTALRTLTDEVAETVRQHVAGGLTRGVNPRTVARDLREVIGLAPNQEEAVRNFRDALTRIGTNRDALDYELRDRRYDRTLARLRADGGELSADQVDAMTTAYRNRALAWNAETHARTSALDAQRAGQREAWDTAIRESGYPRDAVTKRWVATLDARTRPEHAEANGTVVPFDQPYPVDGGVMVPGEGTYNCFPAGTVVEGTALLGLKTLYSGKLVELATRRGHRLTVTANHPVLTEKGWVAAHAIREGDALFSKSGDVEREEPVALRGGVYDEQRPALIEDVFDALAASGTSKARSTALDLHGDAQFTDAEVHVVAANRYLLAKALVAGDHAVDNGRLQLPDAPDGAFARGCARAHDIFAVDASAACVMGGAYLSRDGGGVALEVLPLDPLRFGPAADWDTPFAESSVKDDALIAAFVRELLEASAGAVALDEVIEVRDFVPPHALHVYDLQSMNGWNIYNGIVCSNCRCIELIRIDVTRDVTRDLAA